MHPPAAPGLGLQPLALCQLLDVRACLLGEVQVVLNKGVLDSGPAAARALSAFGAAPSGRSLPA